MYQSPSPSWGEQHHMAVLMVPAATMVVVPCNHHNMAATSPPHTFFTANVPFVRPPKCSRLEHGGHLNGSRLRDHAAAQVLSNSDTAKEKTFGISAGFGEEICY